MKLPSVRQVTSTAIQTFLRFPFPLLAAFGGTIVACILINHIEPGGEKYLLNILLAAILGIPFLIAVVLISERLKLPTIVTVVSQVAGMVLLVAYGLTLPLDLRVAPSIHLARFCLLLVALHFFVSVAPFLRKGEMNGFWQFNGTMLFRVLVSALYSGVLYLGLTLALAALEHLFGLDIPVRRYAQLWVAIIGVFNSWFFLAGVPHDIGALDRREDYPRGLKIFVQYILLPILFVYLIILYAYAVKIIIDWDWPKGWVSGLVLGFSSVGILSVLLLHPIREQAEHRWIVVASRWFYRVLPPLVIMLLLAILRRVREYGITEGRYIVIVLGLWLAAMSLYFLLSKSKSIKIIPASLCAIGFLISVGPWGLFSVSENDQIHRLEALLAGNGRIVNGKIRQGEAPVSFEERRQISSVLVYLHDMHGYRKIQGWFNEPLIEAPEDQHGRGKEPRTVAAMAGIEFVEPWQMGQGKMMFLQVDGMQPLDPRGYEFLIRSRQIAATDTSVDLRIPGLRLEVVDKLAALRFIQTGGGHVVDTLSVDLASFMEKVASEPGSGGTARIAPDRFSFSMENSLVKASFFFIRAQLSEEGGKLHVVSCTADILVALKH